MCTVSYVPQKKGYTLTFNRDESPKRIAEQPEKKILKNGLVLTAPKDLLKGGTWMAIDENGRTACLLNGGFTPHIRKNEYRMSRGHLVINAFEATSFNEFLSSVSLEAIEPFTLLLIEPNRIQQLVWDGITKNRINLPSENNHLWSSSTLFTPAQHSHKLSYFMETLNDKGTDREQLLQVHGKDAKTPFVIDRPTIKTVSITQHQYDGKNSTLTYILKQKPNEKNSAISFSLHHA